MHTQAMLSTHPTAADYGGLSIAINTSVDCAQACIACADACLAEEMVVELRRCIHLNLDCAEVCDATARVASRRAGDNAVVLRSLLQACEVACRQCAEECERHAPHHEHCRICAEACRECERACQQAFRA